MRSLRILALSTVVGVAAASGAEPADPRLRADAEEIFAREVRPLLKRKCLGCHGDGAASEGGLDLRTREAMLRGGDSGPAVVPGNAAASKLIALIAPGGKPAMPPKEKDRLTPAEVAAFRAWVDGGAPFTDRKPAAKPEWTSGDGIAVATSGGQSPDWTERRYKPDDVWAFFPVRPQAVPAGEAHPIDAFLNDRLRAKGLAPAPAADRTAWLRRATFDLTGLPPTPEEIAAFAADPAPDAWEKVIDRLLASPRYGERMAQHWLDVVRYADTSGFSNDYERPNAWRYRDYVVRAFNADKPYDRFVREQIAGDEIAPDDPEARIATGFLRMGPWEHTAMSVEAVTRQFFLDDVTNSVGVTFLGQALSCCRCHDHKFDPLPTRDYYRIQAVFASTQFDEPAVPFLPAENTADLPALREAVARQIADKDWMRTDEPKVESASRNGKKRSEYLKLAAQRAEPRAFAVKSAGDQAVRVLAGGSLEAPGETVVPGVLSAPRFDEAAPPAPTVTDRPAGRRAALAGWIADGRNPLTARVMVNRVWQWHFGTGLVATPNNFGKTGRRPTHPELLDWLAARFVADGWSVKKLHRLIMTSAAYRRGAAHPDPEALARLDPAGELLAVFPPRRLSAEEIRDAMLAVTGELSPATGGPGVFPEINAEAAVQPRHIMGGTAICYRPSPKREQRNRRTIYAFRYRGLADPMLEVFNQPGSDASCERRDETTVTPQVFALFNGRAVHDRALAFAARLEKLSDDPARRIELAFRLVYGRPPTDAQLRACREHVDRMTAHHRSRPPVKTEPPAWVDREMIDEQTGRPFRWREKLLDPADGYEPDLRPWDVGPETRALAELCLVLFNSNEFLYVY
jgi:mono/diheme cytochrome c family protein